MAVQVPLLVALALFMSAEAINAGDPAALPSQKAAVVLPLLREFSPKETSKGNVLEKITKILGKDFLTTAHGPNGAVEELFYELDDRTIIHVGFLDGKLAGITREVSSRVVEILYPASNRSYWIWPFVRASACEPDGSVLVTWWDEKGNFHRYVDAKYVGTGYLGLRDQGDVVEGINADWKITLSPSPDNDDGLEQATADSRIFLAESTLDRDQTFVNVYVNGGLTGTLGPFLRYRRWPVAVESNYNFSSDGNDCTSLLIWKDKTKTTPQVLVIDGNGAISLRQDCEAEVWNPHAAPDGKGVLIEDLRGGDHANTFYWYTEKGKARTTKIASNSSMLGWLPNTHRSLFSTRMGNENRYQLIDWDTGKTLWDIPCPGKGHNLALGITPDLILFSQAELFDGHGPWTGDTVSYYANMPEWFRALYAIDATNGKVVASRRADPGRILDQGLVEFFCWAGGKFYFVTQNEFTELNFNDIKARRNGWK